MQITSTDSYGNEAQAHEVIFFYIFDFLLLTLGHKLNHHLQCG